MSVQENHIKTNSILSFPDFPTSKNQKFKPIRIFGHLYTHTKF